MSSRTQNLPHVLYRLYDAAGHLLYIGVTSDFEKRIALHLAAGGEGPSRVTGVERIRSDYHHHTLESHADLASALQAERAAIKAEGPVLNVVHGINKRRPSGTLPQRAHPVSRAFSDWVRIELIRNSLSAKQLSAELGIANSNLSRRLNYLSDWPLNDAARVAEFFKTPLAEVLEVAA